MSRRIITSVIEGDHLPSASEDEKLLREVLKRFGGAPGVARALGGGIGKYTPNAWLHRVVHGGALSADKRRILLTLLADGHTSANTAQHLRLVPPLPPVPKEANVRIERAVAQIRTLYFKDKPSGDDWKYIARFLEEKIGEPPEWAKLVGGRPPLAILPGRRGAGGPDDTEGRQLGTRRAIPSRPRKTKD